MRCKNLIKTDCISKKYKNDYELKNEESISKFNTTKNFYEGFGQDILF